MSITQSQLQPPPMDILRFAHGPWLEQVLKSAVELNVFQPMEKGPQSATDVARQIEADAEGVRVLLDTLVGMQLLTKQDGRYQLTELSRVYLLPQSELSFGEYVLERDEVAKAWANLTQAIKSGRSYTSVNQPENAQEFFTKLVSMLFPMNFTTAQAVAEALEVDKLSQGARVLDIATGSGVWSIPMAQRNPSLKVDALDFAPVLEVTRRYASRYNLSDRYSYLEGSWQDVNIEAGIYDIVILGHILHSEGRAQTEKLLPKVFKALKPGGRVVIAEFMPNDERTGPIHPLLFAINMYILTDNGCVFSPNELISLLAQAGFAGGKRLDLPYYGSESPIVVGFKDN